MAKHIINKKEDWASEALQGYLHFNNQNLIALKEFPNVVVRKDYASLNGKVALISGGGSGHEPAHVGFIGVGMLTAVVCGNLFASPSTSAIQAAIRFVGRSNSAGVLMIVKNYTGDRLNFGIAASRSSSEGIHVEWILVDDDVALLNNGDRNDNTVGERGLSGTVFVHKIAGALAEQGKPLKEIKETLDHILRNNLLRTLGCSLNGRVLLPGEAYKTEHSKQIELGLGIHGESGRRKLDLPSSFDLVKLMFDEHLLNKPSEIKQVCLMVNNLGGLSNLEMYLLVNDCYKYFAKYQPEINISRTYCDSLMTSLNMNGFSLTLLIVEHSTTLDLLDAYTNAPSWPRSSNKDLHPINYVSANVNQEAIIVDESKYINFKINNDTANFKNLFQACLKNICLDLIKSTDLLNKLDSECGDGDCGDSLAKIAETILKDMDASKFDFNLPHQVICHLSNILENGGGSLSIILSLFASAAAKAFILEPTSESKISSDTLFWIKIWKNVIDYGLDAVCEYGKAKPNQRSIVDPLNITEKSTASTANMIPRVGRASYVDASIIKTPDAGATAILTIIRSIVKSF